MASFGLILIKSKRMDKLYIPGDLVMVKKSALQFAKDKIFKVISSLSGDFVKVVMLNDSNTIYTISNNAVRPMPLTPGILEKNGWKRNGGQYSFTYKPYAEGKVELIGFFVSLFNGSISFIMFPEPSYSLNQRPCSASTIPMS